MPCLIQQGEEQLSRSQEEDEISEEILRIQDCQKEFR